MHHRSQSHGPRGNQQHQKREFNPQQSSPAPRYGVNQQPVRGNLHLSASSSGYGTPSGRSLLTSSSNTGTQRQPSNVRQQQQVSHLDATEFDWGDDDLDADIVMASQAVEASVTEPGPSSKRSGLGQINSSPSNADRMPLEMRRFELAMREQSGGDGTVRMEDIMPGGVLGGEIGRPKQKTVEERIRELEKINAELRRQSHTSKGEATTLRRRLEQERKERQEEILKRQLRETQLKKEEAERKSKSAQENKDTEAMRTNNKIQSNEIRELREKCRALQTRLKAYSEAAACTQSSIASPVHATPGPSSFNSSIQNSSILNISGSKKPPGRSLSSLGFPSVVPTMPGTQGVTQQESSWLPNESTKEYADIEVQTDEMLPPTVQPPPVSSDEEMMKIIREKSAIFGKVAKTIRSLAADYFHRTMYRLQEVPEIAEDEIIRGLGVQGYPYSFLFPENIKVAEYIIQSRLKRRPVPCVLPSTLSDWSDDVNKFDDIVSQYLLVHEDLWSSICYAEVDISKRIKTMQREDTANGLFRRKNLEHLIKVLSWSTMAWRNYIPILCFFWGWSDTTYHRKKCLSNIKSWTNSTLWLCYRHLPVRVADIELRKLSLLLMSALGSKSAIYCTKVNYFRIYHIILDTLIRDNHRTVDNLIACLDITQYIKRRSFYMQYFCRKTDDSTCLAYQFASKGLILFQKERDFSRKHEIYEAYLNLVMEIREFCVEHLIGDKECERGLLPDDPEECSENRQAAATMQNSSESATVDPTAMSEDMETSCIFEKIKKQAANPNATILSYYDYGSENISVIDIDMEEAPTTSAAAAKKPPQTKQTNAREDSELFKVPAAKNTSFSSLTTCRNSAPNTQDFTKPGLIVKNATDISSNTMEISDVISPSQDEKLLDGYFLADKYVTMELQRNPILPLSDDGNMEAELSCTKLLDSSLWEQTTSSTLPRLCQCRLHFMQTFLIMTESLIEIWKIVQLSEKLSETKNDRPSGQWKYDLDKTIKQLKAESAPSRISPANRKCTRKVKLWDQIEQDSSRCESKLTSKALALSLETAVEVIYDSFLASLNGVKDAFGYKGTTALYSSAISLYTSMGDLGFKQENLERLAQLCEELHTGAGNSMATYDVNDDNSAAADTGTSQEDFGHNISFPKQYSEEFNTEYVKSPLEMTKDEILSTIPKSVLRTMLDVEDKIHYSCEALAYKQSEQELRDDSYDVQDADCFGADSPSISGESDCEETEVLEEVLVTSEESDSEEPLDGCGDPISKASSSKNQRLGNIPRKYNPLHVVVPDYDTFCEPTLDDPTTAEGFNFDQPIDELVPKISDTQYKRMLQAQLAKPHRLPPQLARFKSVTTACEKLSQDPNLKSEDLVDVPIPPAYIKGLMETLNVPNYYQINMASEMLTDLNSDPVPFEV